MDRVASSKEALKKRVSRLLRLGVVGDQSELTVRVLPFLGMLGEVGLIGGAIRDVARAGRRGFTSDLDFVIYGTDHSAFSDAMRRVAAVPNKFGGYALQFHHWKVDVWHIDDTWAKTAGHRVVTDPRSLLECTFFDWDSVIFDVKNRCLIAEDDYTNRLKTGVMDIRLEPNPNPEGSLIRALRRAAHWNVKFGPNLTKFASEQLRSTSWDYLIQIDERAFPTSVMKFIDRDDLLRRLDNPHVNGNYWFTQPIPWWQHQMELPFPEPPALSPRGD